MLGCRKPLVSPGGAISLHFVHRGASEISVSVQTGICRLRAFISGCGFSPSLYTMA